MKDEKLDLIQKRLSRVQGQIKAISKMYSNSRSCEEIVQQIQAARAALAKVASMLLASEAKRCVEEGKVGELERVVDRTFKTV